MEHQLTDERIGVQFESEDDAWLFVCRTCNSPKLIDAFFAVHMQGHSH